MTIHIEAKAPYFRLNDINFLIDQHDINEWYWTCREAESEGTFPTQDAAIKDAIRYVEEREADQREDARIAADEAKYGTPQQQVDELWKGTRL